MGSNTDSGHLLHLLETKTLKVVANKDYIALLGTICKALNVLKFENLRYEYVCCWNFYCKLEYNLLPIHYKNCKLTLHRIEVLPVHMYNIRRLVFYLPMIKHELAEQLPDYQLLKLI